MDESKSSRSSAAFALSVRPPKMLRKYRKREESKLKEIKQKKKKRENTSCFVGMCLFFGFAYQILALDQQDVAML